MQNDFEFEFDRGELWTSFTEWINFVNLAYAITMASSR